jgi:surfeit locus 1 family protein
LDLNSSSKEIATVGHERSPWIALAAVIGIAVTLLLGRWQLLKGEYKDEVQAHLQQSLRLAPLGEDDFNNTLDLGREHQRRVDVQGVWVDSLTLYLANRSHAGKSGFWVMTPLKMQKSATVMVVRGWVAWNPSNPSLMPSNVLTPTGAVRVQGVLDSAPSRMLELWGSSSQSDQTYGKSYLQSGIWQNFDQKLFESQTGLHIQAFIRELGEPSDGLIRELPNEGVSSQRNYGYSVQWFLLSALIAFLYLWFQWVKPYIYAKRTSSQ